MVVHMSDFSLMPVDHQPDFGDVSFVPVDHDPFSADGMIQPVRMQHAQAQYQMDVAETALGMVATAHSHDAKM